MAGDLDPVDSGVGSQDRIASHSEFRFTWLPIALLVTSVFAFLPVVLSSLFCDVPRFWIWLLGGFKGFSGSSVFHFLDTLSSGLLMNSGSLVGYYVRSFYLRAGSGTAPPRVLSGEWRTLSALGELSGRGREGRILPGSPHSPLTASSRCCRSEVLCEELRRLCPHPSAPSVLAADDVDVLWLWMLPLAFLLLGGLIALCVWRPCWKCHSSRSQDLPQDARL